MRDAGQAALRREDDHPQLKHGVPRRLAERHLAEDFMVSPELETANAVSASLGIPAARHTDVFADGKVQVVEFDVPRGGRPQRGHRRLAAPGRDPRRTRRSPG